MEVAQGVSQVLGLQQLLGQSDLIQLLAGFSEAEWNVEESDQSDPDTSSDPCVSDIDQYIPYFCGSLRKKASNVLHTILNRSCNGDDYQKGWLLHARGCDLGFDCTSIWYS